MKRIKLFENFDNEGKYLWREAALWIEDLCPEEICFLALYVSIVEYNKKLPYNRSNEDPLFPIKTHVGGPAPDIRLSSIFFGLNFDKLSDIVIVDIF